MIFLLSRIVTLSAYQTRLFLEFMCEPNSSLRKLNMKFKAQIMTEEDINRAIVRISHEIIEKTTEPTIFV